MGTWSVAIKDNDAFADVYSEFYDLYNKGGEPNSVSKKVTESNREILSIEEEKNSFWFALALAQWETKSLESKILTKVTDIVNSGEDLKIWKDLGASESDLKKREKALNKFLEKIKSDRPKTKPRKKPKLKTPIFSKGDCITFKLKNGNYGGAVVLASDENPETGYNLVATTRLNSDVKPSIDDFINSEVLFKNFGEWDDNAEITWCMPDLYYKDYSGFYELVGNIPINIDYNDTHGSNYPFHPSWTSGWKMNYIVNSQIESELTKPRPTKVLTIKELTTKKITIKENWWKKFWSKD